MFNEFSVNVGEHEYIYIAEFKFGNFVCVNLGAFFPHPMLIYSN